MFLELVNYYSKFLPKLSSTLAPLYKLLKEEEKRMWTKPQEEAWQAIKKQLTAACLLTHFNSDKEVVLACDAAPHAIGAVLSHKTEEGEKPIAYASRSLSAAKKYAQLDKEGLSIVFGVKKFHNYLFGKKFEIKNRSQAIGAFILGE